MGTFEKRGRWIYHPYFGSLECTPAEEASTKIEICSGMKAVPEQAVPVLDEEIGIAIFTDEGRPNDKHVKFCALALKNIEAIASKCQSALAVPFEECFKKPLSDDYLAEMKVIHLRIPWGGDYKNDWSISLNFRSEPKYVFEVHFENGIAKRILLWIQRGFGYEPSGYEWWTGDR